MSEITLTQEDLDKKIEAAVAKATEKLAGKNEELIGELKNARGRVKAFEGFSPEDVEAALQKAKDQQKKAAEALADRGEYEKALATAKEQHKEELTKLTTQLEAAQGETKQLLVSTAMTEAMGAAGIADPFRKAVSAMHQGAVSVIEKDGKKMAVVGDKSISDFLTDWAGSDEGKNFVADAGAGGGGAGGGKGTGTGQVNPWAKDSRNLTLQGQMERDNPQVAQQMKREAGVTEAA